MIAEKLGIHKGIIVAIWLTIMVLFCIILYDNYQYNNLVNEYNEKVIQYETEFSKEGRACCEGAWVCGYVEEVNEGVQYTMPKVQVEFNITNKKEG